MEIAAAVADLRVVARTSACRVAGGLVALEDAGPADAVAGRGTEGLRGAATRTPAPLWLGCLRPAGARGECHDSIGLRRELVRQLRPQVLYQFAHWICPAGTAAAASARRLFRFSPDRRRRR